MKTKQPSGRYHLILIEGWSKNDHRFGEIVARAGRWFWSQKDAEDAAFFAWEAIGGGDMPKVKAVPYEGAI
jgi:hypothetical protein